MTIESRIIKGGKYLALHTALFSAYYFPLHPKVNPLPAVVQSLDVNSDNLIQEEEWHPYIVQTTDRNHDGLLSECEKKKDKEKVCTEFYPISLFHRFPDNYQISYFNYLRERDTMGKGICEHCEE